jgi:anti-anti-sigma factor
MSAVQKHSSVEPFPPASLVRRANPGLTATVSKERRRRVVHLAGELDIAAREVARDACVVGDDHHVIVDLSDLTFMDSRGYGALIAARESLERRGVSMTLRNLTGQPARLVGLLSLVDSQTTGSATNSGWKSSAGLH